jgi:hypothetical protein
MWHDKYHPLGVKKRTPDAEGSALDDGANIVHDRAMTGRLRLLAWGAFGLTMAGLAGNLLLAVFGRSLPAQISDWPTFAGVVGLILTFALAGLLISLRFPGNPVGWICGGLALVLSIPAGAYATYAFKLHPAGSAADFSERDGLLQFSLAGVSGGLGARERDLEDRVEALGGSFTVDGDSMSGRIPIRPAEVVA